MIIQLCNIALLFTWGIFLVWLLTFGNTDLVRLLHPRLWWVLGIAAVVLILFLASLLLNLRKKGKNSFSLHEFLGIFILLVPVIYFFMAKEARLDATSLQNRVVQNDNGIYLNNLPPVTMFGDSNSGAMTFSNIIREPRKFENQSIEVVCQSFVNDDLPPNTAMCYRYMITCCAADALPAFIFLNHHNEIENNRWLKVNGSLSIIKRDDMEFPSVKVESIEYVEEPAFPWAM